MIIDQEKIFFTEICIMENWQEKLLLAYVGIFSCAVGHQQKVGVKLYGRPYLSFNGMTGAIGKAIATNMVYADSYLNFISIWVDMM